MGFEPRDSSPDLNPAALRDAMMVFQRPHDLVRFFEGDISKRDHQALMTLALIGDLCERGKTAAFVAKVVAIRMKKNQSTISGYLDRLQEIFDDYFQQSQGLAPEPLFDRADGIPPLVKPRGKIAYLIAREYRDFFRGNPEQ